MAEKTDGVAVAEKTATETGAEKTPTPGSGEKEPKGFEGRIAELTGELHRKNDKIAKLEAQMAELSEKFKSEDEKRIDQLVSERVTPVKSRLEQIETRLKGELTGLLEEIPAEHRGLVLTGDNIPVEDQITQARSVLALLAKQNGGPSPIHGAARTTPAAKPTYSRQEYEAWMRLASDIKTLPQYNERREEMLAARREGRVEGFK